MLYECTGESLRIRDQKETHALEVRPFSSVSDYEAMIDYFLGADDAFLERMGVARDRAEMFGCELR